MIEVIDKIYTADSASDVEGHSTVGLPSELAMTRTLGGLKVVCLMIVVTVIES